VIRVIACDLDGTLLTRDSRIWPRSGRLLHALWAEGFTVVLATGRSWRTALEVQRALAITGPCVAHNGAYVFDTGTEREWHRRPIALPDARAILEFADAQAIMMRCYLGYRQPVLYNRFTLAHREHWLRPEDQWVENLAQHLPRAPVEIFFFGNSEASWLIHRFGPIGPGFELGVFPGNPLSEARICAPGVDKVEGLSAVIAQLGLHPENVLALGDGENDVAMLKWAGVSVAMADGVADAKAHADYVTAQPQAEPVEEGLLWALTHGLAHRDSGHPTG